MSEARRAIEVSGVVQGVGFRPFVFGLASRLGLRGFVKNVTSGVLIEIEGDDHALDAFVDSLERSHPIGARIESLVHAPRALVRDSDFRIERSLGEPGQPVIAPDLATCDACLEELFDPSARRFRYPFINCASCGPRLTIITDAPYDRERTTMASFAMCDACRAEYDDPRDRRFHAQPIACPRCGPTLAIEHGTTRITGTEAIDAALNALLRGECGAIKGLGGFHLACDARSADAVNSLRERKHRDDKPFAIMVADVATAETFCEVSPAERRLLESRARPIVILARRSDRIAPNVAPDTHTLGVMLPYTPLHHLLLRQLPRASALVMTSGNHSDEPIAFDDADARARLAGIADFFVTHDRPIRTRCDDSIARVVGNRVMPMRRSRGETPRPLTLSSALAKPTLAVGGDLKSAFALGVGRRATLSHHLGDLAHYEAQRAFEIAVADYERLFRTKLERVATDAHPDYVSTRYATARGLEIVRVQHHRAHVASCVADAGLAAGTRVVGVAFDGTGYGDDGSAWGGEFFVGDIAALHRVAALDAVALPGGDRAAVEPWRMALSHAMHANVDIALEQVAARDVALVARMIERNVQAPLTSSVGRLFDAVAALLSACDAVTYEARAAIRLEALALEAPANCGAYDFGFLERDIIRIDVRDIVRGVVADVRGGVARSIIARRFHTTLARIVASTCARVAPPEVRDVALTGGCFANAILAIECEELLVAEGFRVHRHESVPTNDGGLALGQLAICAARDQGGA